MIQNAIRTTIISWYGEPTYNIFAFIARYYYIWLPVISIYVFWEVWVRYVRSYFFYNIKTVLLEIKLPHEQLKSPLSMELALSNFWNTGGETTVIDRYWYGKTRTWFSLEIVSNGGDVRFYIWTRENFRNMVESQLYSQYPGVEIKIVEDYSKSFDYDPEVNGMWSCTYGMVHPDTYPLRTYVDYGLEKDPKEELKNDPLTPVLEYFGSMKPGEHLWLQFIIRGHKEEKRNGFFNKRTEWKAKVLAERDKILKEIYTGQFGNRRSTPGENEIIQALERAVRKVPFDFVARAVYFAENKDLYQRSIPSTMRNILNPFSGSTKWSGFGKGFGGFNALARTTPTSWDFVWEDFRNLRLNRRKRRMLDGYKRRMAFYAPYHLKSYVVNTEELATLYHFPGSNASTPGLGRIPSKRGQAPTNLPV